MMTFSFCNNRLTVYIVVLTQSAFSLWVDLLGQLESLCGFNVHIGWYDCQDDGHLPLDVALDHLLDLYTANATSFTSIYEQVYIFGHYTVPFITNHTSRKEPK